MMEQVLAAENLRRAWQRVKSNAGAPGIDGMTVEDFPAFSRKYWPRISPEEVHMATRSRKGYWRMSANSILQRALTNRWLHEHGVPDMRTLRT